MESISFYIKDVINYISSRWQTTKSKKSNETKSNAIPIKKISEQSTRKESAPTEIVEQNKLDERLRRNALEIKRDIEAEEKEIIDQESRWELPAFLRKKDKNENDQSRS